MIEFTKAFKTSDGRTVETLKEAQHCEILGVFNANSLKTTSTDAISLLSAAIDVILENSDKIVDILTTTESCRPKARKINGGKKQRKAKLVPVEPLPPA